MKDEKQTNEKPDCYCGARFSAPLSQTVNKIECPRCQQMVEQLPGARHSCKSHVDSQTEREHECYDGCWEFHCGKCGKFVCECQTGKIINDYKNRPQTERKCCEKCLQHYGLDNWDCLDKLCPCHTQGRYIITKPYRPTKEQNTRP